MFDAQIDIKKDIVSKAKHVFRLDVLIPIFLRARSCIAYFSTYHLIIHLDKLINICISLYTALKKHYMYDIYEEEKASKAKHVFRLDVLIPIFLRARSCIAYFSTYRLIIPLDKLINI